jgi:hypothetical protein
MVAIQESMRISLSQYPYRHCSRLPDEVRPAQWRRARGIQRIVETIVQ